MKTSSKISCLAAAALLSACGGGSDSTVACTTQVVAGLRIQVLDRTSGSPISCGASATVTAPGYSRTVDNPAGPTCSNATVLTAADERTGTYAITVTKSGYLPFSTSNVVVTADECHVRTVDVEARLTPG